MLIACKLRWCVWGNSSIVFLSWVHRASPKNIVSKLLSRSRDSISFWVFFSYKDMSQELATKDKQRIVRNQRYTSGGFKMYEVENHWLFEYWRMREMMSAEEGRKCNLATRTSLKVGSAEERPKEESWRTSPIQCFRERAKQPVGLRPQSRRDRTLGRTLRRLQTKVCATNTRWGFVNMETLADDLEKMRTSRSRRVVGLLLTLILGSFRLWLCLFMLDSLSRLYNARSVIIIRRGR